MTTLGLQHARTRPVQQTTARTETRVRAALLVCGILSSLVYAAMLVVVPAAWAGYSSASQTVSELSAVGAPTRSFWIWLAGLYTLLVALFGCGVLAAGRRSRALHGVGYAMIAYAILGLFWPPMHLRGVERTLVDTLHIAFTVATVVLMAAAIGLGATAFGRRFRLYSYATLGVLLGFGVLTGMDAPRVAANLPTPWAGVWERIAIGAFLLWVAVTAIALLRGGPQADRANAVSTRSEIDSRVT